MGGEKRKLVTMCGLAAEMSRKKTCHSDSVEIIGYQNTLEKETSHLTNNFLFFPDLVSKCTHFLLTIKLWLPEVLHCV